MELELWLLFGLTVTSAAGKSGAGRDASSGASAHKRTLGLGDAGKGAFRGAAFCLGSPFLEAPAGRLGEKREHKLPQGLWRLRVGHAQTKDLWPDLPPPVFH